MPKIDEIEKEKRLRLVHDWLIDDWESWRIIAEIKTLWNIDDRQAKRYIADARDRWKDEEAEVIKQKRKRKVLKLQKMSRSLEKSYKGTPSGIRALLAVEKVIIELESLRPATKVELSGKDGKPIQTESVATVLVIPSNGREIKHAGK